MMSKLSLMHGLLALAFLILMSGFALSHLHHDFFLQHVIIEDGPTEWLTVFVFLCSAGLCFMRWRRSKGRPRTYRFTLMLLFVLFLFGAGEEISWGQRIFNHGSSDFFLSYNAQSETNLHNLKIGDISINKLIFGTGFALILVTYLFVMTPLYHRSDRARTFLNNFAVPIPRGIQFAAFFVLLFVVEVLMSSSRRGEITEVVGALIVFATLLHPFNDEQFDP